MIRKHFSSFRVVSAMTLAVLALCGTGAALRAQDGDAAADPTRASVQVQDVLKTQLAGLRAVTLKGIVMGQSGSGLALLQFKDAEQVLVRSNSQFTVNVAGMPLKVVVRDVTSAGVQIEAPTLAEALLLPSALDVMPRNAAETPLAMRHVEFRDVQLSEALRMLCDQSGTNYSVSAEARQIPVSLFLRNVPLRVALEEICKNNNLWFRQDEQSGVLRVMTIKEFERDLVSFHEERDEVLTLLYPNVVEVAAVIKSLYGDRVRLSNGLDGDDDAARDLASRFQRFDLVNQRSQGTGILPGQGTANGSGIATTVIAGNSGAVWSSGRDNPFAQEAPPARNTYRDLTPDQAQQLQRVLAGGVSSNGAEQALQELRERPASIFLTVIRRNNMIVLRTSDTRALEDIRALVQRLDVPTPMVLLEIKILSLELGKGFESIFDYQVNANLNSKKVISTGGFIVGDIQPPASGSMLPGGTGSGSDKNFMSFQVVSDHFKARMQVLESKNKVTVLATPLLLTANNEVSRLFLGEERPLVRNISGQTIITENSTAVTPSTTLEFRSVGTTVLVTPNINSDRTVTLRLLQEDSSIKTGGAIVPIVTSTGGVQNVSIDVVASRSISGTFVAKDDMVVAIGGLITEKISNEREQIPFLGNIPYLGVLFRREVQSKTRQELVIMIRPHVISTPAEGEGISRTLMKDLSIHPATPDARGSLNAFGRQDAK
jgi:general secretion pathway protein D